MKKLLFVLISVASIKCVSSSENASYEASTVVERIGNKKETPQWAHGELAMFKEGSNIVFIHFVNMAGNSRPEACLKAAELEGRTAFLRHIQESITSSGQLNELNASDDPSYESLTAFLSQGKVSGASTLERYWERRVESRELGERALRIMCSVKIAIKKKELERQLKLAIGDTGNKKIREKLHNAQREFIDGIASNIDSNEEKTGH